MLGYEKAQRSLTREQKEAIGLLSIGTFLEYFDLMLYIHMAVLLNELFFPKADPHTQAIYAALAFCSTYVLRPLGALIFGWIGDYIGRKATVVITTFIMAVSCSIIASIPTYEQIGITATIIVTICRMLQGISSIGEITGAELYLTETIKPPIQYPTVAFISVAAVIGSTTALSIASFFTSYGLNWRYAFWTGALIAFIGSIARTTLRETPEFADAKRRLNNILATAQINNIHKQDNSIWQKHKITSVIYYFALLCSGPFWFYLTYIHCGEILKNTFGYTAVQVIRHNLLVVFLNLLSMMFWTYCSFKIYPLKILRIKLIIFIVFLLSFSLYLLNNKLSVSLILIFQLAVNTFEPRAFPAVPIFYQNFPVLQRFRCASLASAFSRALMYIITSFGIVFLTRYYNYYGLIVFIVLLISIYAYGLNHFKNLEMAKGNYRKKILDIS